MSKRRFDDTQAGDGTAGPNADGLFEIRVLINNHEGSVVIGKEGSNVKNIRQQTNCYLSVKKVQVPTVKDRILTIKGQPDGISKALLMISQYLLEANNQRKQGGEPETQHTFKILIHKFIAGCILGKAGSIVKEIQDQSKARVALSTDVLPGSTEKTITVTGTPEALHQACERIVAQMATNPLRAGSTVIQYVPGQVNAFPPQVAAPGFGVPNPYYPPAPGFPSPAPVFPGTEAQRTEKIVIPAMCGSMLIGKAGSVIKNIKAQSGTLISLAKVDPAVPQDQVVTITGTQQGIQAAVYLIRQRIDSYQPPPAQQNAQPQQFAGYA